MKNLAIQTLTLVLMLGGLSPGVYAKPDASAEVVEKCVEALGGESNWRNVESLEITGSFTSLSVDRKFRLLKHRPNFYLHDFYEVGFPISYVYDGNVAWWKRELLIGVKGDWPVLATLSATKIITLDAEFEMPFLGHEERGHRLEFLGEIEFDGELSFGFEVQWANGQSEQWYVDPDTFLPTARVGILPYIGVPQERRVYFDDYRNVEGILIPFYIETEFGNQHSVARAENVRINPEIDLRVFELKPPGMERLRFLVGSFLVKVESRAPMFNSLLTTTSVSTIREGVFGYLLDEEATLVVADAPFHLRRVFSYDQFRDVFRIAHIDNTTSHLDILEGVFDGERLVLSDVETGTSWNAPGKVMNTRFVYRDIGKQGFTLDVETSEDGGKSWAFDYRMTYTANNSAE